MLSVVLDLVKILIHLYVLTRKSYRNDDGGINGQRRVSIRYINIRLVLMYAYSFTVFGATVWISS